MKNLFQIAILSFSLFLAPPEMRAQQTDAKPLSQDARGRLDRNVVAAKPEETEPLKRTEVDGLLLQVSQVEASSSIVCSLTNGRADVFAYACERDEPQGFRIRLYDANKYPFERTSRFGEFMVDPGVSVPRIMGRIFKELKPQETVSRQFDLTRYFKIPEQRPLMVYLSVWWWSGWEDNPASKPYLRPDLSIWTRVDLK